MCKRVTSFWPVLIFKNLVIDDEINATKFQKLNISNNRLTNKHVDFPKMKTSPPHHKYLIDFLI